MVGPAPTSSFEMSELVDNDLPTLDDKLILRDLADADQLKETLVRAITIPFVWGASDEDSPLSIGLQYTTEASEFTRILGEVIISVKNAPTGTDIEVDILKETAANSNAFTSIFTTKPKIMINEFTSQTHTTVTPAFVALVQWDIQTRLQLVLTINDTNFAATGLKVTLR